MVFKEHQSQPHWFCEYKSLRYQKNRCFQSFSVVGPQTSSEVDLDEMKSEVIPLDCLILNILLPECMEFQERVLFSYE